MEFSGKVALVTGASRGFGKRIALELARRGADVAIAARTVEPDPTGAPGTIHDTADAVRALGRRAFPIQTDLADPEAVVRMVETTVAEFGRIDLLMNNAGIGTVGDVSETTWEDWQLIFQVNLHSQFLAIKTASSHMKAQGGGAIVNMGSYLAHATPDLRDPNPVMHASAEASGPGITPYGSTKAAIERLTLGAAADLGRHGIRVNAIAPHWTETEGLDTWFPEVDKSSWERPEDWARVVAILMSADAARINGQTIYSREKDLMLAAAGLA